MARAPQANPASAFLALCRPVFGRLGCCPPSSSNVRLASTEFVSVLTKFRFAAIAAKVAGFFAVDAERQKPGGYCA